MKSEPGQPPPAGRLKSMIQTRSQVPEDEDRQKREFARPTGFDGLSFPSVTPPDGHELSMVCLPYVKPAVEALHRRFRNLVAEGILAYSQADAVFESLVDTLWRTLFSIISRSMVVELAAAGSTGLLQGETEAERYGFFIECLADEDFALSILEECPPLHLLVETSSQNWLEAVDEMLGHLAEDLPKIKEHFFPADEPGAIVRISLSHGDRHRHGRSVAVVIFASGQKLVYKPRPLAADIGFAGFTDWFNACAGERLLASVRSLARGNHGWCAFVEPRSVLATADLEQYYFRLGALLATVRVLGLSDLHAENLIAAGTWPTIIDLETLFHPAARRFKSNAPQSPATERLVDCLDRSVLAAGLLPIRTRPNGTDTDDLDLAGMSDSAGQTTPFETPHWEKCGTDEMALGFARQTLSGNDNLPVLNERRMAPEPYAEHILAGFHHAYGILQDNKPALLSDDGPLSSFTGAAVRVVVRPTAFYAALLQDGAHPAILQSTACKSAWLRRQLKGPDTSPYLDSLVASELSALLRQDIPCFETVPESRAVTACDGMTRPNFLPECGMDASRKLIAALGADDLSLQSWLIELCLTKAATTDIDCRVPTRISELMTGRPTDLALNVAHLAARQVAASAIHCHGNATWMTAQEGTGGTLVGTPAGLDLYGGLPGIALFLSYAGSVLKCSDYTECGRKAWREVLDTCRLEGALNSAPGAYSGLGGLVFALDLAQQLHPDLPMTAAANTVLDHLDLTTPETLSLEMIDGLAGLMSSLSILLPSSTVGNAEATLTETCRAALAKLALLEDGKADDPILSRTGAAHGLTGLTGALAELHRHDIAGISSVADAALACSERLHARFRGHQACAHRIAWCNGQTGLLASSIRQGPPDSDLTTSLVTRLRTQDYQDDSLCHGSMGAVLALNAIKPGSEHDRMAIDRASTEVLERIRDRGPQCGTIHRLPTPGLMEGLAGIGFAALSLLDPDNVPPLPGLSMCGLHGTDAWKRPPGRF